MSITRFSLAGLAVALVGAAAREAAADNLTINTATTAPVLTSNAANATPGDVTVGANGSITVTAGQTAITVDSDNDVLILGQVISNGADNTTGILLNGGFAGPQTISNSGVINLLEDYTPTDLDSDGEVDGPFAQGTNRNGIWLSAGPAFNGQITNFGFIAIEGNASTGIRLDALLDGDLIHSEGTINMVGQGVTGVWVNGGAAGGVTGDVFLRGTLVAQGPNAAGVVIDAPVTGQLAINGFWAVSGYRSMIRPINVANLDAEDLQSSRSAIDVRYSIGGGITVEGVGVEDDEDDDDDGVTEANGDVNDDNAAAVRVFGPAPVISITADPSANLVLGANGYGFGLHNRGLIEADSIYDGIDATTVRLEGQVGATVTITGGVVNDGRLLATAREADAYGIIVGAHVNTPQVMNRNLLRVQSFSETNQMARGVFIESDATIPSFVNTGSIEVYLHGEVGSATALTDLSNSLSSITNTGRIVAQLIVTDDNLNDNIVPPITGPAVAIDVSQSTINVTFNQTADVPFTDDDAVDDDLNGRPPIETLGEIRFGQGDDTFNLLAGRAVGDLSFGLGADVFNIDNGASYIGRLTDSDGVLNVTVTDGTLELRGGQTDLTTATFGADAELRVLMSNIIGQSSTIVSTGDITFAPGAVITPLVPVGLPASGTHTFLTAGGTLIGGANVERVVTGAGAPWVYNLEVRIDPGDVNSLQALFTLKTPAELGLTTNQTTAFLPIIEALRTDDRASLALASLDTESGFFDALEDLMPSFAGGATELAATAIQQAQSATSNRLAATRLQGLDEVSVWAQEIGYFVDRTPLTPNGQAYTGHGFGFAVGIDGPLDNGGLFGLSASFISSEVEEEGRPDGEIAASFGQVNAYLGTALGPFDLDFIGGVGVGRMNARRFVQIGTDFSAVAEGEWWSYEGHVASRAAMPLRVSDWFVITPQAALTYVALQEDAYTEEGGGDAINFDVDDSFSQRLWGDVGIEFSARFRLRSGGVVAPRLYAGYRANLIDDPAERTFRLAAGGTDFTLTDEALGDGAPLIGFGIDASNGYSTFTLAYEGEFGDQLERHSVNAAVRFRF